jgi:hypothetical protein
MVSLQNIKEVQAVISLARKFDRAGKAYRIITRQSFSWSPVNA